MDRALKDHIPGLETAKLISKGGQKAVYKALFEGEVVALKLIGIERDALDNEDMDEDSSEETVIEASVPLARALREFDILSQVDVPVLSRRGPIGLNTVRIGEKIWLYFTEEWVDGETLRDIIRKDVLSSEQLVRLGDDLIQAVCWLSARNLVHRDIKPANVMFDSRSSRYVLLDPGIALDLQAPSLTLIPVTVGTVRYLSPEQMEPSRKRALDFRSDLFAIGIVMYEAATGGASTCPQERYIL